MLSRILLSDDVRGRITRTDRPPRRHPLELLQAAVDRTPRSRRRHVRPELRCTMTCADDFLRVLEVKPLLVGVCGQPFHGCGVPHDVLYVSERERGTDSDQAVFTVAEPQSATHWATSPLALCLLVAWVGSTPLCSGWIGVAPREVLVAMFSSQHAAIPVTKKHIGVADRVSRVILERKDARAIASNRSTLSTIPHHKTCGLPIHKEYSSSWVKYLEGLWKYQTNQTSRLLPVAITSNDWMR